MTGKGGALRAPSFREMNLDFWLKGGGKGGELGEEMGEGGGLGKRFGGGFGHKKNHITPSYLNL